jgi:hypothetical protein
MALEVLRADIYLCPCETSKISACILLLCRDLGSLSLPQTEHQQKSGGNLSALQLDGQRGFEFVVILFCAFLVFLKQNISLTHAHCQSLLNPSFPQILAPTDLLYCFHTSPLTESDISGIVHMQQSQIGSVAHLVI